MKSQLGRFLVLFLHFIAFAVPAQRALAQTVASPMAKLKEACESLAKSDGGSCKLFAPSASTLPKKALDLCIASKSGWGLQYQAALASYKMKQTATGGVVNHAAATKTGTVSAASAAAADASYKTVLSQQESLYKLVQDAAKTLKTASSYQQNPDSSEAKACKQLISQAGQIYYASQKALTIDRQAANSVLGGMIAGTPPGSLDELIGQNPSVISQP